MTTFLRTLSWAVYLAMSWTWCIGMFLPVILVSEFGIGAWFVFAIPNVIGAAAMGWTLAVPGASERIVAEHRSACVAFSAITLAFQTYFLIWMTMLGLIPAWWTIAAISMGAISAVFRRRAASWDLLLAWLVLCVSLTVMGKGLTHPVAPHIRGLFDERSTRALFCLMPICAFGFLLCPYLDLTFHRARQALPPNAGRVAFALGFGVFFLAMILLTLLYERDLSTGQGSFAVVGIRWIALHIAVQIGFKWSAHLRALPRIKKSDGLLWLTAALTVIGGIVALRQQEWFDLHDHSRMMLTGELVYRLFMSFYGLIFPAYVLICIVPIQGRVQGFGRPSLMALIIAVLIAAPMFWVGFIQEKMLWLIPGIAIVILSRLLLQMFYRPDDTGVKSHLSDLN